MFGNISQL